MNKKNELKIENRVIEKLALRIAQEIVDKTYLEAKIQEMQEMQREDIPVVNEIMEE